MTALALTPLEPWIARRLRLPAGVRPTAEVLAAFHLDAVRRNLALVRGRSPFYRRLLADQNPSAIGDLEAFGRLPLTTADDLRQDPMAFLALSQAAVARVVTLHTSGTTRAPKRIFFSEDDLEATLDFFHHGMTTLARPGDRVLVLLSAQRPESVGRLLAKALDRMGARVLLASPESDIRALNGLTAPGPVDVVVGMPLQVLALARRPGWWPGPPPRAVLVTADFVPRAVVSVLEATWGCGVFQHYGMTETGLGGGVECAARNGYHLREADLYVEVIDPPTGRPLPLGQTGEVVVTTLNRRAMPLVRYRTGDLASFMTAPCPCGSVLRRLAPVQGRIDNRIALRSGAVLTLGELDEALIPFPGVVDLEARILDGHGVPRLTVTVHAERTLRKEDEAEKMEKVLAATPILGRALAAGAVTLGPVQVRPANQGVLAAYGKRNLKDQRAVQCR